MDKQFKLAAGFTDADFAEMTALSTAMKDIDPANLAVLSGEFANNRDLINMYVDRIDPEDFANAGRTAAERVMNDLKMAAGVPSKEDIEDLLNPWKVGMDVRREGIVHKLHGVDEKLLDNAMGRIDADTLTVMNAARDRHWEQQNVSIPTPTVFNDYHFREVRRREEREQEKLELTRRSAEASEGVLATALQQAADAKLETNVAKRETKKMYAIAVVSAIGGVAGLAMAAWPFC